jgi:hypothetical protein
MHEIRSTIRRLCKVIGLACLLAAVLTSCGRQRAAMPSLPVIGHSITVGPANTADPVVLSFPNGIPGYGLPNKYVVFSTGLDTTNVDLSVSSLPIKTANGFIGGMDALPKLPIWAAAYKTNLNAFAEKSTATWGPSVIAVGRSWVLYYSTRIRAQKIECIGAATSKLPGGPYVDDSLAPLICQRSLGGSIDPDVVRLRTGELVLVWKSNGSKQIWEQQLSQDGARVVGKQTMLLEATQRWEHGNVEGPDMLAARKGGWWLFYSGAQWYTDSYGTGVAWCRSVNGPCAKPRSSEILRSEPGAFAPGGLSTFRAVNGTMWVAYSAYNVQPTPGRPKHRVLHVAPLLSY